MTVIGIEGDQVNCAWTRYYGANATSILNDPAYFEGARARWSPAKTD
jgi:indole-3-glycerol phosphate synthase